MAQESGAFSVRRPRETLGGLNHNASAIPMPTSAMKRSNSVSNLPQPGFTGGAAPHHGRSTSSSRMSLAPHGGGGAAARPQSTQPVFQRSSSGTNLADLGYNSVHRNSSTNMRKSFAAGAMAATPAHHPAGGAGMMGYATGGSAGVAPMSLDSTTQRRSSVYGSRPSYGTGAMGAHGMRQSFFSTAPPAAGIPQDPRRLKDSGVRAQMANELMDYLTQNGFELEMKHSLSAKSMTSPTQKDFNCMFQWLYKRIDPSYRFQKNIDAEVPPLLKQLRYPFEKSIMKSQIAAVGGNNWYTFLGLLHWMMQLARMMDMYAAGHYDDACADAGYDVSGDRIIFDFLSDAYRTWLSVDDEDDDGDCDKLIRPHIEQMAARFDAANAQHLEQVKMLEAEHKSLTSQIEELSKAGPRIAKLDEHIRILEEDKVKFEEYNARIDAKVDKLHAKIAQAEDELRQVEQELTEAEQEKQHLQEMVDAQGITIGDIDRMQTERERLRKNAETTATRLEESRRRVAEKEAEAGRKLDELERLIEKFNSLGYQIGLIPSTAPNAKGNEYELVLKVSTTNGTVNFTASQLGSSQQGQSLDSSDRLLAENGAGYQPHQLLNLDLRGAVKSNILSLRKDVGERRNAALEADMNNHDLLHKIKEAMDDKQAEVEALGHKVNAAEEEFEKTREITTAQKMASDTQIERMEKELAKMRAGLTESVQLMEQREMNTNIEYEQLTLRAASLREELHTEIERMLNDIIKFKVHIQKSLEDYESFVAEELERECEEQEMGEAEEQQESNGT
ncbi:HEC/Ndc80p family protein-like protein [Lineolata rhizophorae]|uniref:Kinetochore protein NDC80 n=1 Tax=Lineolata rhizophorae TaxID=578093 RepID=A0A6A6NNQ1_9PEZI|nr:HEC/Ndc80p family protein-like protein [Lineolata rhizophorae]